MVRRSGKRKWVARVQSSSDAMDLEQTGRFIARCKYYTFCFVMAAVESLFMPFGTVLAVFTLVVLLANQ